MSRRLVAPLQVAAILLAGLAAAPAARGAGDDLATLVAASRIDEIRELGPEVMPRLAALYEDSGVADRMTIAGIFYALGWRSAEAETALMEDIHTSDENLRIQVQYALGRVSDSDAVVDVLLDNMQTGFSPLVRDKAGCSLAYDQIHLTERQKLRLFERLVELLESSSPETRSLAIRVLHIHTGQAKGYRPNAPAASRAQSIERWRAWLEEYAAAL